jgi:hypothetical protein
MAGIPPNIGGAAVPTSERRGISRYASDPEIKPSSPILKTTVCLPPTLDDSDVGASMWENAFRAVICLGVDMVGCLEAADAESDTRVLLRAHGKAYVFVREKKRLDILACNERTTYRTRHEHHPEGSPFSGDTRLIRTE